MGPMEFNYFFNGQGWVYTYPSKPSRFIYPIYPSAKIIKNKALFQREIEHLKSLDYELKNCSVLDEKYMDATTEWWFAHRSGETPSESK